FKAASPWVSDRYRDRPVRGGAETVGDRYGVGAGIRGSHSGDYVRGVGRVRNSRGVLVPVVLETAAGGTDCKTERSGWIKRSVKETRRTCNLWNAGSNHSDGNRRTCGRAAKAGDDHIVVAAIGQSGCWNRVCPAGGRGDRAAVLAPCVTEGRRATRVN